MASRAWILASLLVLAFILAANAHFLFVAVSSAPGCVEADDQSLRPAKAGC